MTIFKSIAHSQSLLQTLSKSQQSDDAEVTELFKALSTELENIQQLALQLADNKKSNQMPGPIKPETKDGCYIFENEKGFFCPNCYDQYDKKVPTARINKKLRVCPSCRASIK